MDSMSRRRFISVAAGTAALSAGAKAEHRRPKTDSPNDKIGLALIGCGGRGSQVIQQIARLPGVQIVALCDPETKRAESLAGAFNKDLGYSPKTVQDLRRVYDDKSVDAVMISTPEHWHAPATVMACQAGQDVYVEKHCPLGIRLG